MAPKKDGCVKPAAGPISSHQATESVGVHSSQEVKAMLARVGKEAPDFEANAYDTKSGTFRQVKLSDYKGKWITLCFYPGDFTFV